MAPAGTATVLAAQVLTTLTTAGRMMHGTNCKCIYTVLMNSLHDLKSQADVQQLVSFVLDQVDMTWTSA